MLAIVVLFAALASAVDVSTNTSVSTNQTNTLMSNYDVHLASLMFTTANMSDQLLVHAFCNKNTSLTNCVLFDGNSSESKLIGLMFLILSTEFDKLPQGEKQLWHSHRFSVSNGLCTVLDVKDSKDEDKQLDTIADSFGKAFYMWPNKTDDRVPLGAPSMLWMFTERSQVDPNLFKQLQALTNATANKSNRTSRMENQKTGTGADSWQNGTAWRLAFMPEQVTVTNFDQCSGNNNSSSSNASTSTSSSRSGCPALKTLPFRSCDEQSKCPKPQAIESGSAQAISSNNTSSNATTMQQQHGNQQEIDAWLNQAMDKLSDVLTKVASYIHS